MIGEAPPGFVETRLHGPGLSRNRDGDLSLAQVDVVAQYHYDAEMFGQIVERDQHVVRESETVGHFVEGANIEEILFSASTVSVGDLLS